MSAAEALSDPARSADDAHASNLTLRAWLHGQLDPAARRSGLSPLNVALSCLVVAAVALAVLETEPTLVQGRARLFRGVELIFAALFAIEYLTRLWCAGESDLARPWAARGRWTISAPALIDLLALLPALMFAGGVPAYGLRLIRLMRILRIARLGRFSTAWTFLAEAISSRRYELMLTLFAALVFMLVSATMMYLVEGAVQPVKFGSIPRALWWAAVTLTTVGYGDVTPVTPLGRVLAGVTAFVGIGLVAAPTGILAAAFSDAAHRRRQTPNG